MYTVFRSFKLGKVLEHSPYILSYKLNFDIKEQKFGFNFSPRLSSIIFVEL